ncbi:MAG: hypothetical protein K9M99_10910 [Candidatus Cloacimonetes bacterium]|nr:hypothetical protein [Candidatus Cloacimonadota bacterium]
MKHLLIVFIICAGVILNAQLEWDELGVSFTEDNFTWWESTAVLAGEDVILTWSETGEVDSDIFICRYNSEGESVWEEPVVVCDAINIQRESELIKTSDDNFIICWRDFRDLETNSNYYIPALYLQKIDGDGNTLWTDNGILVNSTYSEIVNMISDENGGCIVAFKNENGELEIRNYNNDGSLNSEMGIITKQTNFSEICPADRQLFLYNSDIIIVWQSYEDAYYINIDRYDNNGNSVWEESVSHFLSEEHVDWKNWAIIDTVLAGIYFFEQAPYLKKINVSDGMQINDDLLISSLLGVNKIEIINGDILLMGREQGEYIMKRYDLSCQLTGSVALYNDLGGNNFTYYCYNDGISVFDIEQFYNTNYSSYFYISYSKINNDMEIEDQYHRCFYYEGRFEGATISPSAPEETILFQRHNFKNVNLNMLTYDENEGLSDEYSINRSSSLETYSSVSFLNSSGLNIGCNRRESMLQGFTSDGNILWPESGYGFEDYLPFKFNAIYDEENEKYLLFGIQRQDNLQYKLKCTGLNMEDEPEYLWGEDGFCIIDNRDDLINAGIGKFDENNYLMVWNDNGTIFAQKMCDGELTWDYPGIELINMPDTDYHSIFILEDYIVLASDDNLYITRLSEDGSYYPGWNGFISMSVEYNQLVGAWWLNLNDSGLTLIW